MDEKDAEQTSEEPAPLKDSDAKRVTKEEDERASKERAEDSSERSQE